MDWGGIYDGSRVGLSARCQGLLNEAVSLPYRTLRGLESRDETKRPPDALCSSKVGRAEPVVYEC